MSVLGDFSTYMLILPSAKYHPYSDRPTWFFTQLQLGNLKKCHHPTRVVPSLPPIKTYTCQMALGIPTRLMMQPGNQEEQATPLVREVKVPALVRVVVGEVNEGQYVNAFPTMFCSCV